MHVSYCGLRLLTPTIRAFAVSLGLFCVGTLLGATTVILSPTFRDFALQLLQVRVLAPLTTVVRFGGVAVFSLVFLNNAIPVVLSVLYAIAILRISWTPPLSQSKRSQFLGYYTGIVSFLIGFFDLGATLAVGWALGGSSLVVSLLSRAWVHGPLEFFFVLVSVSWPLKVAWMGDARDSEVMVRGQRLLLISLSGLLVSGAIEVFLGI